MIFGAVFCVNLFCDNFSICCSIHEYLQLNTENTIGQGIRSKDLTAGKVSSTFNTKYVSDVKKIFAKMSSNPFSTQQFLKLNSPLIFPQVVYESCEKLFDLGSNLYKEFVENRFIPRKVGIMSTISRNSHLVSSQNCDMFPCTETRPYWRFFQKSSPISLSA